jgi:hypothetical protein
MAAPTIEDAIALLSDPSLRAACRPVGAMQQMRGDKVLHHLQERGLTQIDARELASQAVTSLGGVDQSGMRRWGLGGRRTQWLVDYWVPSDVISTSG